MNRTEEDEQASPLAPGTMCRATYTFSGVCDVDLPFEEGDEITILEPCNALFWYLAKDKKGNQGVVPVTHIELINNGLVIPLPLPQQTASHSDRSTLPPHSPHSLLRHEDRPPPPLPPPSHQDPHPHPSSDPPIPKYRDMSTFLMKSGWFHPSVDSVLMAKTKFNATELLQKVRTGVYVFIHKAIPNLKYVGKSSDLYHELHRLFDTLYAKSNQQLNPLEFQLRYAHPDAGEWYLRLYRCRLDDLDFEFIAKILEYETLSPMGLNNEFVFAGREMWEKFCVWYPKWKNRDDPPSS